MKKIVFVIIAAMFSMAVFAQDRKITEIKTNQLPKAVSEYVSKNLGGGAITRAAKIEEKGVTSYMAMVDLHGQKRPFLFDKDGKFVGKGDDMLKSARSATPPVTAPAAKTPAVAPPAPKK
ncbi:MAG: hypothetical protein ACOYNC_02925 [Bacteroidales bacterium]